MPTGQSNEKDCPFFIKKHLKINKTNKQATAIFFIIASLKIKKCAQPTQCTHKTQTSIVAKQNQSKCGQSTK